MRASTSLYTLKRQLAKFGKKNPDTYISKQLQAGSLVSFIQCREIELDIPASFWRSKAITLKLRRDRPDQKIAIEVHDLREYIANDLRLLNESMRSCTPPEPMALSVLGTAWQLRRSQSDGSLHGLALSALRLCEELIALNDRYPVRVTDESIASVKADLRKQSAGTRAVPGPDAMFEALIRHIVLENRYPTKALIHDILLDAYSSLPDKDRLVSQQKTGKKIERCANTYFDERAAALYAIIQLAKKHDKLDSIPPPPVGR